MWDFSLPVDKISIVEMLGKLRAVSEKFIFVVEKRKTLLFRGRVFLKQQLVPSNLKRKLVGDSEVSNHSVVVNRPVKWGKGRTPMKQFYALEDPPGVDAVR